MNAFRADGRRGEIGITLDLTHVTGEPEAARRLDGHRNRWFLDPVLRGGYPADLVELYEERFGPLEFVLPGDLDEIAAPIDFLGVNFYQPAVVRPSSADGPLAIEQVPWDGPRTAMGWTVEPSSLTALLLRLKRDYGDMPLMITENGASYDDPPLDGQAVIEDPAARSPSSAATSRRSSARSKPAWTCAATTSGRCSTTSSGSTATTGASGSSRSTSRTSSARPSEARSGTAT